MVKKISTFAAAFGVTVGVIVASSASAFAHVVVSPREVETAARQVFSVGVPNESDTASVVGVRLVIPAGLESVRPNAKAGWSIEVKKTGEGDAAKVSELVWTGGSIPVDQRDEFLFQAKAPAEAGDLQWKAYETYSDGKVVAWEEEPSEKEGSKPYSVTRIVADTPTASENTGTSAAANASDNKVNVAIALGVIGVVLSATALFLKRK